MENGLKFAVVYILIIACLVLSTLNFQNINNFKKTLENAPSKFENVVKEQEAIRHKKEISVISILVCVCVGFLFCVIIQSTLHFYWLSYVKNWMGKQFESVSHSVFLDIAERIKGIEKQIEEKGE